MDSAQGAKWVPITGDTPKNTPLLLGRRDGIYQDGMTKDWWVRGYLAEDGSAEDDEGRAIYPTHVLLVPDIPSAEEVQ